MSILPNVFSALEKPDSGAVLIFLRDVVKIDVANYNATLQGTTTTFWPELGDLPETIGKYSLNSGNNKADILFRFIGQNLTWCLVRPIAGKIQYSGQVPSNFEELTKGFLLNYQAFNQDPSLLGIENSLDNLDFSKNSSTLIGNHKLTTTVGAFSFSFELKNVYYGASYNRLGFTFENGEFSAFSDDRSYYKVGDPTVNISSGQAIEIALRKASTFSYSFAGIVISNFTFVKEHVAAELLTQSRYKPLELYPYWRVNMPLNDLYPGSVNSVEVTLWADTGEVIETHVLELGGWLPPNDSPSPTPSYSNSTQTSAPSLTETPTQTISPTYSASPSPSASQQPTPELSSTPVDGPYTSETDLGWILYATAILVIVVVASLVYFKKIRKQK